MKDVKQLTKKPARHPWLMLSSIYITQYIGLAFIMSAAIAILREQGIALDKLALLNLVALPLMGKIFYAPLIDKYRPSLQGTYRSWLVYSQAAMAILLLVAGAMDLQQQFGAILLVLAIYVFFMSIQDVAVDGLSCKLFDTHTRKQASSVQFSGNLMGNIIGGGVILMLYPWLAWQGALWLLAGLTSISLLQILIYKEPTAGEETRVNAQADISLLREIKQFIGKNKRWFFIMALYPIGSTCGFALLSPLLVDNNWPLADIGFAMKIFGSIIGLFSAWLATPLITKIGRVNALVCAMGIQAVALALIIPLTLDFTSKLVVYLAIAVHFISFPMLLVISATIMMDNAAGSQRKATFFTLQFSFASFLGFAYSAISMAIAKQTGYYSIVITGSILTLGIALLSWYVLKERYLKPSKEQQAMHSQRAVQQV